MQYLKAMVYIATAGVAVVVFGLACYYHGMDQGRAIWFETHMKFRQEVDSERAAQRERFLGTLEEIEQACKKAKAQIK